MRKTDANAAALRELAQQHYDQMYDVIDKLEAAGYEVVIDEGAVHVYDGDRLVAPRS